MRRTESTNPQYRASSPVSRLGYRDPRFEQVLGFVFDRLGDTRHERSVAQLAGRLFVATRHWHGLDREVLPELRLGCLLHDIGRSKDHKLHPLLGSRIIRRSRRLPLTARERRLAAFLARFHRGAVPAEGHDDILRPGEWGRAALLLALLRAADGLDSRSSGGADVTFEVRLRKLVIHVTPHLDGAKARKSLARRKKFRLLEELLGISVRVRLD